MRTKEKEGGRPQIVFPGGVIVACMISDGVSDEGPLMWTLPETLEVTVGGGGGRDRGPSVSDGNIIC